MPHWLIKSAIHHAIALLPGSQKWNEWFQVHVTKSLELSQGEFEKKLEHCRRCLEDFYQLHEEKIESFAALELGTGWYPVVPLALYLCGAGEVRAYDIYPLVRPERLKTVLKYFCDYDVRGVLQQALPRMQPERMTGLRELLKNVEREPPDSLLKRLNIHLLVRDAQNTGLPEKSIDLFFSYSVLEYIPAGVLSKILAEFKRLSRKEAVMVHYIDLFDQFCRFDQSITCVNFLKYSNAQWNWRRSPLIPMNRLRICEYRSLITVAGFEIFREQDTSAPVENLARIRLAPEFRGFSKEDLLVTNSWLAAKSANDERHSPRPDK